MKMTRQSCSPVRNGETKLVKCQCEHECHLTVRDLNPGERRKLSPNGNPGHGRTNKFYEHRLVEVKCIYGTFKVCPDCAEDCYDPEVLKEAGLSIIEKHEVKEFLGILEDDIKNKNFAFNTKLR